MSISIRRAIKLIGPYPYNPYLIFLFFFALFFSRFIPVVASLPPGYERIRAGALIILASSFPSLVYALGAIMLRRYRFWSSKSTILYVLEVAFFLYLNLLFLPIINSFFQKYIGYPIETLIGLSLQIFFVTLVLTLISLALMHRAEKKITDQLELATKLVDKLESERAELIQSYEKLRSQTSQFLHDRVQSELMIVGMKLRSISGHSSPVVNDVIDLAIHRLESTRSTELKELIQNLTPNLDAATLQSALDSSMGQYRTNMEVSVRVDDLTEKLGSETLLGIFRIIEQSVLNSLVHGSANRVEVSVRTDLTGVTEIVVSDDGAGTVINQSVAGMGTAIIDSWVGILKGSKEIDSAPGHGYRLRVTFPE